MRRRIGLVMISVLLCVAPGHHARADEEVAKFLLEQAKKAISLRHYDEAVTKLERARVEDPALLEASYLLGQVFEKMKQPGKALGAYRAFRDACAKGGAAVDKKCTRLLGRAEKRIATLGKGERELEKLQKSFGDQILTFARRHADADEDIAIDALRRLVAVMPDRKDAAQLLGELTGEGDLTAPTGEIDPQAVPIKGIEVWEDLLRTRAIPPGGETSYKRKVLTIDKEGNTIFWTDPRRRAPDVFVYEMEFRFVKEYANGYLLGLAFGEDEEVSRKGGHELVMAMAQKSLVTLLHASGSKNIEIAQTARKATGLGTWHRLTAAVEGRKVRVFLDGKQVLNAAVPGRKTLAGPVGLFHQRCVAEIRILRLGTRR